jgi:hypothetical protein
MNNYWKIITISAAGVSVIACSCLALHSSMRRYSSAFFDISPKGDIVISVHGSIYRLADGGRGISRLERVMDGDGPCILNNESIVAGQGTTLAKLVTNAKGVMSKAVKVANSGKPCMMPICSEKALLYFQASGQRETSMGGHAWDQLTLMEIKFSDLKPRPLSQMRFFRAWMHPGALSQNGKLYFVADPNPGDGDNIYFVDLVKGGNAQKVSTDGRRGVVSVSPSGGNILFTKIDGDITEIWIQTVGSKVDRMLMRVNAFVSQVMFSKKSGTAWIMLDRKRDEKYELINVDLSTGKTLRAESLK